MKIFTTAFLAITVTAGLNAQQKEGKVIYERAATMQISFSSQPNMPAPAPIKRTDRFELNFANNQMSWKQMEEEMQDDNVSGGPGFQIRTMGSPDDMVFCDFNTEKRVEQREMFDKKFIINDTLAKNKWKLSDDTKTILNHVCRKATTQRISQRFTMSMNNGTTERKEIADTSDIVAWYTTDVPVSAGPDFQGQLPGLILELQTNKGNTVYTATEISSKVALASIKEPTKGKKVTNAEFTAERNKMLEEMQKNSGGRINFRTN